MPDDLTSIEGLADKHSRALGGLHIVDLRGLADADPQAIYRTMANLRPRPTPEQIAGWQDRARDKLGNAVPDPAEWHTMASFVVVFSQRQVDAARERRVEAEQTEVKPEQNPQVWSGWDCGPVCDWMHGQLSQAVGAEEPPGGEPAGRPAPAGKPVPAPAQPSRRDRAQLSIDSASIIDAAGRTEVVPAPVPPGRPRTELVAPVRVVFTVGARRPARGYRRSPASCARTDPAGTPRSPVTLASPGQAEFDLAQIPAGDYDLALVAWAPDATAEPVRVRLPTVTIRSAG